MVRIYSRAFLLLLVLCQVLTAEAPWSIEPSALKDFDELPEFRQNLIRQALAAREEVVGLPYKYGGNGAKDGGFDCSGAIYHILIKAGLKPPRTSADQFLWVKEHSKLHPVPLAARVVTHGCFASLMPGDLVFWTGTYEPDDKRVVKITHVALFLGYEKKDGLAVMINATDGRSYRGVIINGYGVCDFRVPKADSKSRMVGYGAAPGLPEEK